MKYQYWHIITAVSEDYKNKLEVGEYITHHRINDGPVCMINRKTGKVNDNAYTLKYIKRLPTDMESKEKLKILDAVQEIEEK